MVTNSLWLRHSCLHCKTLLTNEVLISTSLKSITPFISREQFIEYSWSLLAIIFKPPAYLTRIFTEWGIYNVTRVSPTNNLPKNDLRQQFWSYLYKISNLRRHRNKVKIYCQVYGWLKTEFGLVIGFIGYLQVITIINYYTVTDFYTTKHCMLISSVYIH
jgi:hypothetical protein